MSSTITHTELKTIPSGAVTSLTTTTDEKQVKLVRSSSIERIKRFNTFICSQQYYILPAILSWIKSSQTGLQSSTEKTIFFFRSLFFKSMLYKYCAVGVKTSTIRTPEEVIRKKNVIKTTTNIFDALNKCLESTFLLAAAVYGACAIVLVQFVTTIYLLYLTLVPYGFLFLVACMLTIKYLCYRTMFFYLSNCAKLKTK